MYKFDWDTKNPSSHKEIENVKIRRVLLYMRREEMDFVFLTNWINDIHSQQSWDPSVEIMSSLGYSGY